MQVVWLLLTAGADPDCRVTSSRATPLHMAALAGRLGVARALLAAGAAVQPRAGEQLHGATPLYLAAQSGHTELARTLLGIYFIVSPPRLKICSTISWLQARCQMLFW